MAPTRIQDGTRWATSISADSRDLPHFQFDGTHFNPRHSRFGCSPVTLSPLPVWCQSCDLSLTTGSSDSRDPPQFQFTGSHVNLPHFQFGDSHVSCPSIWVQQVSCGPSQVGKCPFPTTHVVRLDLHRWSPLGSCDLPHFWFSDGHVTRPSILVERDSCDAPSLPVPRVSGYPGTLPVRWVSREPTQVGK